VDHLRVCWCTDDFLSLWSPFFWKVQCAPIGCSIFRKFHVPYHNRAFQHTTN